MLLDILADKDKFHAFVTGDICATILTTISVGDIDWIHPIGKLGLIAIGGIFGGFFSPVGKKLFEWVDKKLFK